MCTKQRAFNMKLGKIKVNYVRKSQVLKTAQPLLVQHIQKGLDKLTEGSDTGTYSWDHSVMVPFIQ